MSNTYLQSILANLVTEADKTQRVPARYLLGGGLHISILVMSGRLYIQLMRENTNPSETELDTVLRSPPFSALFEWRRRFESDKKFYLRLAWLWPIPKPGAPEAVDQPKLI